VGYFALLTPAYIGHVNPMSVLARALMRRRHRVVMIAQLDAEERIRRAGVEFIPIGEAELPKGEWERRTEIQGELTGFAASRYVGKWLGDCARGYIRDLPKIIERERFDGLVMDQICLGAEAVCEVSGLPLAVACNALALNWDPSVPPPNIGWKHEDGLRARLRNLIGYVAFSSTGLPVGFAVMNYRRRHRLGQMRLSHMNWVRPSLVQVAQQPAFFDFPRKGLPKYFHYTAPWKESSEAVKGDFPWERLDGRPLIYASMGTLQNRLEFAFGMIAEACAGLDAQLVIALGRKGGAIPTDLAGDPIVVGYAPQMALLQRASMVITHGGMNSTLETLREGLPMVVLPITNDQPGVAARVEYLGLGRRITLRDLTVETLKEAVSDVFSNPKYRETARRLSHEMNRINGPEMAAELIDRALTTRRSVERAL
jgi:zeaxanthin glucosyltransferase